MSSKEIETAKICTQYLLLAIKQTYLNCNLGSLSSPGHRREDCDSNINIKIHQDINRQNVNEMTVKLVFYTERGMKTL